MNRDNKFPGMPQMNEGKSINTVKHPHTEAQLFYHKIVGELFEMILHLL
jgi:hypothetical protein